MAYTTTPIFKLMHGPACPSHPFEIQALAYVKRHKLLLLLLVFELLNDITIYDQLAYSVIPVAHFLL